MCARIRPWLDSWYCCGICLGRLRTTTENLSQDNRCFGWDQNCIPSENSSELLRSEPICAVEGLKGCNNGEHYAMRSTKICKLRLISSWWLSDEEWRSLDTHCAQENIEIRTILWLDSLRERHRWEDNIKTDLTDFCFKHMKQVQMGHETFQW
jgi:hypothetical protein